MEEKQNKRKTIILLIIGTIALIGAVVGATFAYFAAQVGTGDKAQINAEAGTTDSLTFDKGKDLVINANQSNFYENAGDLKDSTTLSAHLVAGNDDNDAHYKYNIYLDIASNNFEYTSDAEPELVLLVQDPEETYLEDIPGLTKSNITIDGESHPCFDITTQSGLITIQEDYLIDATPETQGKADHTWNITVVFKNLSTDQHNNTNKTFNAKITIQSEKMNFLAINGIDYESCLDDEGYPLSSCLKGDISYYREGTYRNKIKNAYFIDHIDIAQLNSTVKSYDLSSEKDGSIMAWLVQENEDENAPYNLYIGSNKKILVRDFSWTFYDMKNLETIDLGTDVLDTTNMNNMSYLFAIGNSKLTTINGLSNLDTHNVTNMTHLFYKTNGITTIEDIGDWDTKNVTDMSYMFYRASGLTNIGNLSNWDVSNVTDMSYMFYRASGLTNIGNLSNWDVSNVTNMSQMFDEASSLTELDLSQWDTQNVTDMSYMFSGASNLKSLKVNNWVLDGTAQFSGYGKPLSDIFHGTTNLQTIEGIESWDVSKVTDMSHMFSGASGLIELDLSQWDTQNVTNMYYMFGGISKEDYLSQLTTLDLSNWDVSKVTDMSYMFSGASNLRSLKVNNWVLDGTAQNQSDPFSSIFYGTTNLQIIEGIESWDVSKVTDMHYMFSGAKGLTSLDLSNWDTSNVTDMYGMFSGTTNLTSIDMRKATFSQVTSYSTMFYGTNSELNVIVTGDANKEWFLDKIAKSASTGFGLKESQLTVLSE